MRRSHYSLKILIVSLLLLSGVSKGYCQGYENPEYDDYLSPSFFYDLLGIDSTFVGKRKPTYRFNSLKLSSGYIHNYQYRNSYAQGDYVNLTIFNNWYTNKVQVNTKLSGFYPLYGKGNPIQRGKLQVGFYTDADMTYDSKFVHRPHVVQMKSRRTGKMITDTLQFYFLPEPPRLLLNYQVENHLDSATYHDLGFEFFIGMKYPDVSGLSTPIARIMKIFRSAQGGYIFSWRLNSKDFFYGFAFNYEFQSGLRAINAINFSLGACRNRVLGNDRWGNVKYGINIDLNILPRRPVKVFYTITQNLVSRTNNHEYGVAFNFQRFSAFRFMESGVE